MNKITKAKILSGDFSTPWDAPLVPPFPFEFRDLDIMSFVYKTDIENIKKLLPPPLKATSDIVMVHVYDMHDVDYLGHYQEANFMIEAELATTGQRGAFSPYLFLNSDIGVAHGREVHGQPKKFAEPKIELRKDLLVATVERNGIDIFTGTMAYKQQKGEISDLSEHMDFAVNFNLKAVNNIDGSPAIRQLTSRKLADLKVRECWRGFATVELRPNAQAPVFKLAVKEMIEAFYWKADFTLVAGQVIYDYLKEEK